MHPGEGARHRGLAMHRGARSTRGQEHRLLSSRVQPKTLRSHCDPKVRSHGTNVSGICWSWDPTNSRFSPVSLVPYRTPFIISASYPRMILRWSHNDG